jgi:hypothetical protein
MIRLEIPGFGPLKHFIAMPPLLRFGLGVDPGQYLEGGEIGVVRQFGYLARFAGEPFCAQSGRIPRELFSLFPILPHCEFFIGRLARLPACFILIRDFLRHDVSQLRPSNAGKVAKRYQALPLFIP